jgi:hypothetical protein
MSRRRPNGDPAWLRQLSWAIGTLLAGGIFVWSFELTARHPPAAPVPADVAVETGNCQSAYRVGRPDLKSWLAAPVSKTYDGGVVCGLGRAR